MARLSNKTAKIFLSLLLLTTRQNAEKADCIKPEFATRGLEVDGFIPSIAYNGRPRTGSVVENNRNVVKDKNAAKVNSPAEMVVGKKVNPDAALLVSDDMDDSDAGGRIDEDVPPSPLERCRIADENGDRKAQVEALVACWDAAFPIEEYPYQRLTIATAKKFLVNRSAEDVGQVILRVGALGHSDYPRSRVEKALTVEDKRDKAAAVGSGEEGSNAGVITDELKEYSKWALEQWKKDENSSRYK